MKLARISSGVLPKVFFATGSAGTEGSTTGMVIPPYWVEIVAINLVVAAKAIDRAFGYAGRPYDFDFDFYTDTTLVCSELVYKAYEPREGMKGIKLGLEKVVGRMALGPNAIVRTFDSQRGTPDEQMSFVWFLDGTEKTSSAAFADEAAFRKTWQRPKWDVVQK